jgi:ribosomal protein L40E
VFDKITNLQGQIESLKAEIADAKDMKICPNCKAEMPKEAVACMKCGHKFE